MAKGQSKARNIPAFAKKLAFMFAEMADRFHLGPSIVRPSGPAQ